MRQWFPVTVIFSHSVITNYDQCNGVSKYKKIILYGNIRPLTCETSYVGAVGEAKFSLIRRHNTHIAPWPPRKVLFT